MTDQSPFSSKRYEHDGKHLYYLPARTFSALESAQPTFLVGTRGTGKTTLLRALSWEERLFNSSLQAQVSGGPFDGKYVGIYFKLPNVQCQLIDRWLADSNDLDYASIFCFYLDLCWIEQTDKAVGHLASKRIVSLDRNQETAFATAMAEMWSSHSGLRELSHEDPPTTWTETVARVQTLRRSIERLARFGASVPEVLDSLPIGQAGSFGITIGRHLVSFLRTPSSARDQGPDWSFRVCMDEGEVLTLRQQRSINTAIRISEWPVFYVVAYVSPPLDALGTYLPNQSLQQADRQVLMRDEMPDSDFKDLAIGVTNVRLKSMNVEPPSLDLTAILGHLNVNRLLHLLLRDSESKEVDELLQLAHAAEIQGGDDGPSDPPIYQTYLYLRRPEMEPIADDDSRGRRRRESARVRKQMVAAYLSVCAEARKRPWYAYEDMVLQMSDNCVRDFLWQMDELFRSAGTSVEDFLCARMQEAAQNRALLQAASNKMQLVDERVVWSPSEVTQVVEGLARVTARIQSTGRNFEQLRSPERGIFSYKSAGSDAIDRQAHLTLIRDAAEAGYLKLLSSEADELRFRVHASLAPYYEFSYRGAYYDAAALTDADLASLREATTTGKMDAAVDGLVQRITGRRPPRVRIAQEPLPLSEGD